MHMDYDILIASQERVIGQQEGRNYLIIVLALRHMLGGTWFHIFHLELYPFSFIVHISNLKCLFIYIVLLSVCLYVQ